MPSPPALTHLLVEWRKGNQDAANELFAVAYHELRSLAAWHLQQERPGHTLQPTALVNELYLKLFGAEPIAWQNRSHFFAVAAQQIRRLLIDYARAHHANKRGGGLTRVSWSEVNGLTLNRPEDLLDLDEALHRLETLDARVAGVIELRFFAGVSEPEAAKAIGISVATLKRDWEFGRAWLTSQLKAENS